MGVLGWSHPKCLIERDMFLGIAEVILPTNDVSDPHLKIIHHIHEMKDGASVFPSNHKIRFNGPVKGHIPANHVFHHARSFRHLEFKGSPILIRLSCCLQFLQILCVNRATLTLKIRSPLPFGTTLAIRTLIPIQSQPPHPAKDHIHSLLRIS